MPFQPDDEAAAKASYYDAYWKQSAALWALFQEPRRRGKPPLRSAGESANPLPVSHAEMMAKMPEPYRSWRHDGSDVIAKSADGRVCDSMTDLTKDELIDALKWSYRVSCEIIGELRKSLDHPDVKAVL